MIVKSKPQNSHSLNLWTLFTDINVFDRLFKSKFTQLLSSKTEVIYLHVIFYKTTMATHIM